MALNKQDTLLDILSFKLNTGEYDCMICVSKIGKRGFIWSCEKCFAIFHISCLSKWISKSLENSSRWRCPGCSSESSENINEYRCFCRKSQNPEYNPFITPHSCGQLCMKTRMNCVHPCNLVCHPGPCPPCGVKNLESSCPCGKKKIFIDCGIDKNSIETCDLVCNKMLNCKSHFCKKVCHVGSCSNCTNTLFIKCHCENETKEILCGAKVADFSCGKKCGKELLCKKHLCQLNCHAGECAQCTRKPDISGNERCACGKHIFENVNRKSCLDPLPTCKEICLRFKCEQHRCNKKCHDSSCGNCKLKIRVTCLCGKKSKLIECFKSKRKIFKCKTVCKRVLNCGRHFCQNKCCNSRMQNDPIHQCKKMCMETLNCGFHQCEEKCHSEDCPNCKVQLREGSSCNCGKTKIKGFLFCGQKNDYCQFKCDKKLQCGHFCKLNCHFGECPSCIEKVTVECAGGHTTKTVLCSEKSNVVCCFNRCNKTLSCGEHFCERICHAGECNVREKTADGCGKRCISRRKDCAHLCGRYCHPNKDCCEFECTAKMRIYCQCKLKSTSALCKEQKKIPCDGRCKAQKMAEDFRKALSIKKTDINEEKDGYPVGFSCPDLWENNEKVQKHRRLSFVHFSKYLLDFSLSVSYSTITKTETKLEKFLKDSSDKSLYVDTSDWSRRKMLHSLASHYKMTSETLDRSDKGYVCVRKDGISRLAKPRLSTALRDYQLEKDSFAFDWPIGCVLHAQNTSKSQQLERFLVDFVFGVDSTARVEVLRKTEIFLIFKNNELMLEMKEALKEHNFGKTGIFAAKIIDEIGLGTLGLSLGD